jgi:hypothetical protein
MRSTLISLDKYYEICSQADISPNYHPKFVEFYFAQLRKKPKIISRINKQGQVIAAYPVLYGQIFPNSLHKRLLRQNSRKLGDIGQPEALFPVVHSGEKFSLNCLSPTTSPLISSLVRKLPNYSIKNIAIAKQSKHKRLVRAQKSFFSKGGKVYSTEELDKNDFADVYLSLHAQRWGYATEDLRCLHEQILNLYEQVDGGILVKNKEPVAALLCYKAEGKTIYYVDAINLGVKLGDDRRFSYGSIMLLSNLRRSEEIAHYLNKKLRYSYGYHYGARDYKNLWAYPEKTYGSF